MKRIFLFSLALLPLLLWQCSRNSEEKDIEDLATVVAEVNKKCPQVIDPETRIDGLEFKAPATIRYNYTLLNLHVQAVDTHQFRIAMWPGILSTIRVSDDMKPLRDNGATIEYYYQDKEGKPVYLFTVKPQDYK